MVLLFLVSLSQVLLFGLHYFLTQNSLLKNLKNGRTGNCEITIKKNYSELLNELNHILI